MWCPSHSSAWIALSQHIGHGRIQAEGSLRLTMERQGGAGLIWSLRVAGQRCRAWCEETAWCQWIAPLLPVPALAHIDKALLTPLALWSWQPLMMHLVDEQGGEAPLQITPPTEGTLAEAWDPQLILVREDAAQLALRLLDWPAQWLIERSRSWKPLASGPRVPPLAISVVAGWCRLPDQVLETIRLGEGLRLSGPVDLWHGEAWLFQEQPLARVRFTNTQQATVEAIMAEHSDWPPEMGNAVQALSITVVAEIGQLWVPLEQLAALQVGEVLQGESLFEGSIRLKANGRYLGSGQLIEVGGHWVVQIDCWFNQQPLTSSEERLGGELVANGLLPCEPEASGVTPVDLINLKPAVDALRQERTAAAAVQEEALESAVEAVEAIITKEEQDEEASTSEAANEEVVMILGHDGGETSEEESTVAREEAMIVKPGIATMSADQGTMLEQHEQAPATTTGYSLPVTAAEPAGTPPPVVMPPKPPRPPKALRTAMNSMAKAVAGRRKPHNPSTV